MTSRVTKRVKYFVGKLLKKKDFEKEQNYHLDNKKHGKVKGTGVAKANIKGTSVKKNTDN